MDILEKAIAVAKDVYRDMIDEYGRSYVDKGEGVMNRMSGDLEMACGVLQDIFKVTNIQPADLGMWGVDSSVISTVTYLTQTDNEDYDSYIERVSKNLLACHVKLGELVEVQDYMYEKDLTEEFSEDYEKYRHAAKTLNKYRIEFNQYISEFYRETLEEKKYVNAFSKAVIKNSAKEFNFLMMVLKYQDFTLKDFLYWWEGAAIKYTALESGLIAFTDTFLYDEYAENGFEGVYEFMNRSEEELAEFYMNSKYISEPLKEYASYWVELLRCDYIEDGFFLRRVLQFRGAQIEIDD